MWVHLGFEWVGFVWVGLIAGFGFENTPLPAGLFLGLVWVGLGLIFVGFGFIPDCLGLVGFIGLGFDGFDVHGWVF